MMQELAGKTVLITGATDGLGRALAERAAGAGAHLILHGRSLERGHRAMEEIAAATGNDRLELATADLAELAQVENLAAGIARHHDRLDVLVSNAGIGTDVPGGPERQESADGHELRFAVNYLAGYSLIRRLLPLLRASAPARIVQVSSAGQAPIDFDDVMLERSYSGVQAYCQSKLAQIMFAFDLAAELEGSGVSSTALHPATYMPTKIVPTPTSTVAEGVDATWHLVADPEVNGVTGAYFNTFHEQPAHAQAYDADARRQLRELSERLTGV